MTDEFKLTTLAEYRALDPFSQGYVIYMQAEQPGSELRDHQKNLYPEGSDESAKWLEGGRTAAMNVADCEE